MKRDFSSFKIGSVFNPVQKIVKRDSCFNFDRVKIRFPSRLNAMALDPGKIVKNNNMVYSPGELLVSIKVFISVSVCKIPGTDEIRVDSSSSRRSLIRHSALLMKQALGINDGLTISINNENEMKHSGLGSSSRLIAAVAVAINELYDLPISSSVLVKYVAQNHGEEIDGEEDLICPVQCIGGSASSGINCGGIQVLAGNSVLVKSAAISEEYAVVIGVPKDFCSLGANEMLEREIINFPRFKRTGKKYGATVAYRMLHEVLPSLTEGDIGPAGNLIYDYRFKMGSVENCSFVYSDMVRIAKKLAWLKNDGLAHIFSISSVGPAFFTVLHKSNMEVCKDAFREQGLNTFEAEIENGTYEVKEKK